MGGEISREELISNVSKIFAKGNTRYTQGDLQGAKYQYMKALSELAGKAELGAHKQYKALSLSNLGCLEFLEGRLYFSCLFENKNLNAMVFM